MLSGSISLDVWQREGSWHNCTCAIWDFSEGQSCLRMHAQRIYSKESFLSLCWAVKYNIPSHELFCFDPLALGALVTAFAAFLKESRTNFVKFVSTKVPFLQSHEMISRLDVTQIYTALDLLGEKLSQAPVRFQIRAALWDSTHESDTLCLACAYLMAMPFTVFCLDF